MQDFKALQDQLVQAGRQAHLAFQDPQVQKAIRDLVEMSALLVRKANEEFKEALAPKVQRDLPARPGRKA